jgi:hypothetical protein
MSENVENVVESKRRFQREARLTELQIAGLVTLVSVLGLGFGIIVSIVVSWLVVFAFGNGIALYVIGFVGFLPIGLALYGVQFLTPRWFERKQLKRVISGLGTAADVRPYEFVRVGLPSVIYPLLLAILLNLFIIFSAPILILPILVLSTAFGFLSLMFAFIYHHVPNCRRSVKYAAFFTGSVLLSTVVAVLYRASYSSVSTSLPLIVSFLGPAFSAAVFLAIYQFIQPTKPLVPGEQSTRRALSWLRWTMSVGPGPGLGLLTFVIIRFLPIVGECFWAARIWSKERMAQMPVLFLRSFSHPAAPALLAKAVAPALSRTCVMVALVHPTQTSAALNRRTHEGWIPLTISVPNDRWQDWFLRQLSEALAVVVDASEFTPHLNWEIENSIRVLGRDRVAALVPIGQTVESLDCVIIEFEPKHPATAKRPLKRWIDQIAGLY